MLSQRTRPKVPRSVHAGARDVARDIVKTHAYVISRRERKKVEMSSLTSHAF